MPRWISGQQILAKEEIQPLELFQNYVRKGLQPYSQAGRALSPKDLMESIWDRMLANADHSTTPTKLEGSDEVFHISNSATLQNYISIQQRRIENIGWADFQLPNGEDEASAILTEIGNLLFLTEQYSGFLPVQKVQVSAGGKEEDFSISKEGEHWRIIFKGEASISKEKGFVYISYLLQNQNNTYRIDELSNLTDFDGNYQDNEGVFLQNDEETYEEKSAGNVGTTQYSKLKADKETVELYRNKLKEIINKINEAKERKDFSSVEKFEKEGDTITKELNRIISKRGTIRSDETTDDVKRKNRIAKRMERAIESVKKNEQLYNHLKKSLTPNSFQQSYRPSENIDWKIRT